MGQPTGQPPLEAPNICMKFPLGHVRADTSTFRSVQLVPAPGDKMMLDINFDHRNAVFFVLSLQKESKVLVMRHSNQLELAPPGPQGSFQAGQAMDNKRLHLLLKHSIEPLKPYQKNQMIRSS